MHRWTVSIFFFLLIYVLSTSLLYAQEILGKISNQAGEPIPGVNVIVYDNDELAAGVPSDPEGNYRIVLDETGSFQVTFSAIGYLNEREELVLEKNEIVRINIILKEDATELSLVEITSDSKQFESTINTMSLTSSRMFTLDQTERFAASVNDPTRLSLSFAGVKGQDDVQNAISIRGNNPNGLVWLIDGVEVPSPNHFSNEGGSNGAVTMLSSDILNSSDFYTGSMPAEIGNGLSGAFDLRLRPGSTERFHGKIHVGMLGTQALLEGPLKKGSGASFIVNYRYSTLALVEKFGLQTGNTISKYQDLNMHLRIPTKKAGIFSFFGLGGLSRIELPPDLNGGNLQWKDYNMGIAGLSHLLTLSENVYLKQSLFFIANKEEYQSWLPEKPNNELRLVWRYYSQNVILRYHVRANYILSDRTTIRSGFEVNGTMFDMMEGYNHPKNAFSYANSADRNTLSIRLYSQVKHEINDHWIGHAGFSLVNHRISNEWLPEPRAGLVGSYNSMHRITISAGLHSRMRSIGLYAVRKNTQNGKRFYNESLKIPKALHLVAGYRYSFAENWSILTEVYFQHIYDVQVAVDSNKVFSSLNNLGRYSELELDNDGLGRNIGIEFTLEKRFSSNYYLLISGSKFKSTYRGSDGVWRSTAFNAGFTTSLSLGKEFLVGKTGANRLGLNGRVLWSGGYYTKESDFEEQQSNYFRMDLRLSYRHFKPRYDWQLSLDIQNATNRLNENITLEIDPVGMIPVLAYEVKF